MKILMTVDFELTEASVLRIQSEGKTVQDLVDAFVKDVDSGELGPASAICWACHEKVNAVTMTLVEAEKAEGAEEEKEGAS